MTGTPLVQKLMTAGANTNRTEDIATLRACEDMRQRTYSNSIKLTLIEPMLLSYFFLLANPDTSNLDMSSVVEDQGIYSSTTTQTDGM